MTSEAITLALVALIVLMITVMLALIGAASGAVVSGSFPPEALPFSSAFLLPALEMYLASSMVLSYFIYKSGGS
jgi:hypothetical protein